MLFRSADAVVAGCAVVVGASAEVGAAVVAGASAEVGSAVVAGAGVPPPLVQAEARTTRATVKARALMV